MTNSKMMPERANPVLRAVPMPADLNGNGHIFGGWVLSQMDIAGGILVKHASHSACATVAIDSMSFIAPILVGDLVSVYGDIESVGRTSVAVRMEVIATRYDTGEDVKVTEGLFTYVALDEALRPCPVRKPV